MGQCLRRLRLLERLQAKACPGLDPGWKPVRVKKTRQIRNSEPRFDSIETEKALTIRDALVSNHREIVMVVTRAFFRAKGKLARPMTTVTLAVRGFSRKLQITFQPVSAIYFSFAASDFANGNSALAQPFGDGRS
jgi:hypothetical protein